MGVMLKPKNTMLTPTNSQAERCIIAYIAKET